MMLMFVLNTIQGIWEGCKHGYSVIMNNQRIGLSDSAGSSHHRKNFFRKTLVKWPFYENMLKH